MRSRPVSMRWVSSDPRWRWAAVVFQWPIWVMVWAVGGGPLWAQSPDGAVNELTVNTVSIVPATSVQEVRDYFGVFKARRSSELSFDRGGRVNRVFVQEGQTVIAGEVIAELDTKRLTQKKLTITDALERARKSLTDLQPESTSGDPLIVRSTIDGLRNELNQIDADMSARVASAEGEQVSGLERLRTVERKINLLNESSRQKQIEELKQRIAEFEGQQKDVEIELESGKILAPFDGVVSVRHVNEGTVVSAGMPISRLFDNKPPLAWVGIPVDVASKIQVGQEAWLVVGEKTIPARTKAKLPQLDQSTRTRTITLEIVGGPDEDVVVPGEVVTVKIWIDNPKSGFWIPMSALKREIQGLWSVYAVSSIEGRLIVVRHYIELLQLETDRVLVRGTIQDGEQVIVEGTHRVVPGQRVQQNDVSSTYMPAEPAGESRQ